eukprot:2799016-Rhodomonas_salina.4
MKFVAILSCLACVQFLDVYSVSIHPGTLNANRLPSSNSAQDSLFFVPALFLRNTHDRAAVVGRGVRLIAERKSLRCRLRMARSRNEESFEEDDDLPIEINSSLSFYRSDNGRPPDLPLPLVSCLRY